VSTVQFRPDRTALAVALVAFLGAIPLALSSFYLAPAFLVPLGVVVWVLRARVGADRRGLEICNGLGVRRVAWDDVDRFEIPDRGPVVLHSVKGATLRLTALARRDLPAVLEVSKN
jgi:hypothetical protein